MCLSEETSAVILVLLISAARNLFMAHRKRNGKLSWRSKKANHGTMPTRGKEKRWGKKAKRTK